MLSTPGTLPYRRFNRASWARRPRGRVVEEPVPLPQRLKKSRKRPQVRPAARRSLREGCRLLPAGAPLEHLGSLSKFMAERDYLAATRERVVVFDGGMGATLEMFDLTQEDYGGLAGKCHEALVLNRPDVIEEIGRA